MARGKQRAILGPLEAEVMEVVWGSDGPVAVRAMLQRLNRGRRQQLAYTTVMTVMARLVEKEVLSRRRDGRGYVYEATVSDPAEIAVRSVVREYGDAALAHFVDEAKADPKVLRRLRRMLSEES
jgi:predicted transcriptional regulator